MRTKILTTLIETRRLVDAVLDSSGPAASTRWRAGLVYVAWGRRLLLARRN
jgi:hypothetical protein